MSSLKGITPLLASSKQILSEKKHAATKNLHLAPASVGLEAIFFLKLFFWGGGSYVDPCPKVDANLLIFNELIAFWSCRWGRMSISTLYDLFKDIALPHSRLFSALRAWPIWGDWTVGTLQRIIAWNEFPFYSSPVTYFQSKGEHPSLLWWEEFTA